MTRYPAPDADRIFSEEEKIGRWRVVTDAMALQLIEHLRLPQETELKRELLHTPLPTIEAIRTAEQWIGHDVVAFLRQYTLDMSDDLKRHIHYGLTSQDIVDNAQFDAMAEHAHYLASIMRIYFDNRPSIPDIPAAGRTHGQIAELTSWRHRFDVWEDVLRQIHGEMHHLSKELRISKSPGPTGVPHLREKRGYIGRRMIESTQVIPRDYVLRWAALYLRLATHMENLALQIRLASRAEVGEVREGASLNRVGSSAMPHKRNPIASERVCGLARVVRGHFLALAEGVALWEDRDLTNSSTERIAVTEMAKLTEHMARTMFGVVADLRWNLDAIDNNITTECFTNLMQSTVQYAMGLGPFEAGEFIREAVGTNHVLMWPHLIEEAIRADAGQRPAQVWSDTYQLRKKEMLGE